MIMIKYIWRIKRIPDGLENGGPLQIKMHKKRKELYEKTCIKR